MPSYTQEGERMKLKRILALSIVSLALTAICIGSASASWSGTEASSCNNLAYASWTSQIGGSQNVAHGAQYSFGPNTFHNSYSSRLYIQLYGSDGRSGSSKQINEGYINPGYTSSSFTCGPITAPSSTGWDYVFVQHYYGTYNGDTSIWVSPAATLILT